MKKKTRKKSGRANSNGGSRCVQRVVRRLANDFELEARGCERVEGKLNGDQAHAIRWCKKELLKAFAQPSNTQLTETDQMHK